jgi:type I restriction enzyme M protein
MRVRGRAPDSVLYEHGHVLTPGRHVGAEEDEGEPFDERFPKLVANLEEQFAEGDKLVVAIRAALRGLVNAR